MKIENKKRFLIGAFLIVIILSVQASVFAQIPPDVIVDNARVSLSQIDTTNFPEITLTVSVTDQSGLPLTNLSKSDFMVLEEGEEQEILKVTTVKTASSNLSVLLILDTSGSMQGTPLNSLKKATKDFISLVPSNWKIGLLSFSDSVVVLSDFISDKNTLNSKVDSIYASNRTALFDALSQGIEMSELEPNIGAIVVFTDGMENASKNTTRDSLLEKAASLNFPVYSIGYTGYDSSTGYAIDEKLLTEISKRSNGKYYFSPSYDEIKQIYNLIPKILENQYEITYKSNFQGKKGENIKTGVLVKDPVTGKWIEGEKQYTSPKTVEVENIPVIIIPGITGSLYRPAICDIPSIGLNILCPGIGLNILCAGSKLTPPQTWGKDGSNLIIYEPVYYYMEGCLKKYGGYDSKTLYLFPYNWSLQNEVNAYYLKWRINEIKKATGSKKVDIIAHSMGGLVARAYIENLAEDEGKKANYENDVRTLIMVGTPNQGSVKAYYTWEGGVYKSPCVHNTSSLPQIVIKDFTFLTKFSTSEKSRVEYIQEYVKSVQQLLPVHYDYITNASAYPRNEFLEKLNSREIPKGIKYIIIEGTGNSTAATIAIKQSQEKPPMWKHGEPIDSESVCSIDGDETVLQSETKLNTVKIASIYTFNETHSGLMKNNEVIETVIKILKNKEVVISEEPSKITDYGNTLSVIFDSPCNAVITAPDGTSIGYNPNTSQLSHTLKNALYYGPNGDGAEAFFIFAPEAGKHKLSVFGTGDGEVHTYVNFVSGAGEFEQELNFQIRKGEEKTLYFTLDSESPQKSKLYGSLGMNSKYLMYFLLFIIITSSISLLIYFTSAKPAVQAWYLFDGSRYYQVRDGIIIGRSSSSDIRIDDSRVSKEHAKINVKGSQIVVQDLGSSNGTFVNKQKIKTASLSQGDRLQIGPKEFSIINRIPNAKDLGYFSLIYNNVEKRFCGRVVIGRDSKRCRLVIVDSYVSQVHTEIFFNGKEYIVRDLGSKNGTYVNGIKIAGEVVLRSGYKIMLGRSTIIFKI